MSCQVLNGIKNLTRLTQGYLTTFGSLKNSSVIIQSRNRHHWNPKWKKLRAEKVIKVKLPDYEHENDDMSEEKARTRLKELGLQPSRPWMERQIFIGCTGDIFEPYVPPEGDGKFSTLSTAGAKQRAELMAKKGKSYWSTKKIKSFEEDFSFSDFEEQAQEIYIKTHETMAAKDKDALRLLVTERAYPEVLHNVMDKTVRWKFLESIQLPRTVHVRCTDVITKNNVFAQITVRFHTQQTLAVYDRFGRLMHGSEILKKDVLEYVVFEKHLANKYGSWRIHGKIIPPWAPPRDFGLRTYIDKPKETIIGNDQEPSKDVAISSSNTKPTEQTSTV